MGCLGGDFIDVMRDDGAGKVWVRSDGVVDGAHELLATAEVEAAAWFVEQHDGGCIHSGASEKHALLFARGEGGDLAFGEMVDPHVLQADDGAPAIGLVVAVPPGFECGVLGRHDDFEGAQLRAELGGEGGRHVGNAPTKGAHVGVSEPFSRDDHLTGAGVQVEGGNAHQRRFARTVGTEDDPVLAGVRIPVDVVEDDRRVAVQRDVAKFESRPHLGEG